MSKKPNESEQTDSNEQTMSEKDASSALSDYFNSKFDYLPPSFNELFQGSQDAQDFSKLMLNLLRLSKSGPLSDESIENIELAIRQLIFSQSYIFSMMNSQNSTSSNPNSPSKSLPNYDQIDQIEINRLRSSYLKLKSNFTILQKESNGYKNKISSLQSQIGILEEEKKSTKKSLQHQKKEYNEEIAKLKEKDNDLTEKYQDALTKIQLLNGNVEGLKNQLKLVQEETDESLKQNKILESKLSEKKKALYKLKVEMKKQNILFEQNASNQALQDSNLESTINDRSVVNSSESTKLKAQLDTKIRDIANLKEAIKSREAAIDAHKEKLESQNSTMAKYQKSIDDLQKQTQQLQNLIQQKDSKINEMKELLDCRANELMNLRDLLTKISEQLSNDYNVEKLTDIPEIIDDLLQLQGDENDKKLAAESFACIDGLTRFIDVLLMNDKTDLNLLIETKPILGDRDLLNQITNNINKLRTTLEENFGKNKEESRMFDSLLSAKEHFSEDKSNCEFASLVIICAANEKLRKLCIQQKKTIDDYQKLVPLDKYNDFRKLLNSYEKINTQIFKDKFDDKPSLLSSFLDHVSTFYHRMKIDVLPTFSINCDFLEIPDNLLNFFNELSQSRASRNRSQSEAELQNQNNENNNNAPTVTNRSVNDESYQSTINEAEVKINKLETQNKKLEEVIKKLMKKVQSLSSEKDAFKEQYNSIVAQQNVQEDNFAEVKEKIAEAEERERKAQLENERLQSLLEQRQDNFQARLDSLLQAERENAAKEMARNEKMWQEEKKSLLSKLDAKTAKYNYQRKADHELIEFLENQIKKSQEDQNSRNGSASNTPKKKEVSNGSLNITDNSAVEDNEFLNGVVEELKKVVHIKGEWNTQKALAGIKKIVSVISKSNNDDKKSQQKKQ